jgi:hypothetical protein
MQTGISRWLTYVSVSIASLFSIVQNTEQKFEINKKWVSYLLPVISKD